MNRCYTCPEDAGISSAAIQRFLDTLTAHDYRIHALMIARRDGVCYADAAAPYTLRTPHRLCSAAKSILVLDLLAAMERGLLRPEDRVLSFFPDVPAVNSFMEQMTVEDLLTMRTGQTEDPFGILFGDFDADLIRAFLETPPAEQPGMTFRYNNSVPHMICAVTEKAVGMSLPQWHEQCFGQYMDAPLLAPTNPRGQYNPVITSASADALMRYALLFLREGDWFGRQLVEPSLIRQAAARHTAITPEGRDPGYGYQIWRNSFGGYRMDGGWSQYAVILPEQDAAVVILSDMTDSSFALKALEETLLPALSGKEAAGNPVPVSFPAMLPGCGTLPGIVPFKAQMEDGRIITLEQEGETALLKCFSGTESGKWRIGLNGRWLPNPAGLWNGTRWSIDTCVYGVEDDAFYLSGCRTAPDTFLVCGKLLREMGEHRYEFSMKEDEPAIRYTPSMMHDIPSLDHAAVLRGRRIHD